MLGQHSSIVVTENSEYAREMRKHEALHTKYGSPGRPYVRQEFPKRLYQAVRGDKGVTFDGFTVHTEDEQRNMQSRGWSVSQPEALEALNREHTEHGKLAAERNFEIKHGRISEKAASEVRAAEAEYGARHLPEVPAKPMRRRGPNKPKVSVPA